MNLDLNNHRRSEFTGLTNADPAQYMNMEQGDRKSFSTGRTIYRELFYILLLFNLLYFAVFFYLYVKGSVKIY